jgi:hypothetical protein
LQVQSHPGLHSEILSQRKKQKQTPLSIIDETKKKTDNTISQWTKEKN